MNHYFDYPRLKPIFRAVGVVGRFLGCLIGALVVSFRRAFDSARYYF
jgi:hypothetical protein